MVSILRNLTETRAGRRKSPKVTASEMDAIVTLLNRDSADVQLAAIEALGEFGSRVHTPYLYPLLEANRPEVQRAVVTAIGKHEDKNAESLLLKALEKNPSRAVREAIVEVIAKFESHLTTEFCSRMIEGRHTDEALRETAFEILSVMGEAETIQKIITKIGAARVSRESREVLLRKMERWFAYGHSTENAIRKLLLALDEESQPTTRGLVAANWYFFSREYDDGEHRKFLDRRDVWRLLMNQPSEAIEVFIESVPDLDEYRFESEDIPHLLKLVKGNAVLEASLVFDFSHIGGPEIAQFMVKFLGERESLWALSYFARHPSPLARSYCEREMQNRSELSEAVLAAICLAALGLPEAKEFLIKNVTAEAVYEWVKLIARPYLDKLLRKTKKTNEKKRISNVLKRLPERWP